MIAMQRLSAYDPVMISPFGTHYHRQGCKMTLVTRGSGDFYACVCLRLAKLIRNMPEYEGHVYAPCACIEGK